MRQYAYYGYLHLKIQLADCSPMEEKGVITQLGKQIGLWRTGIQVILLLAVWLCSPWLVAAQSPEDTPPIDLAKKVTVDLAVAGNTLTYHLVLTNTGQKSLEEVVVSDTTPAGTTLFGVNSPPGWMMTTPGQGRQGQVTWQLVDPLPPGAIATLEFIVTVNLDATGPIINDTYLAEIPSWPQPITGPPVITELVSPTPTWTPPVVPTETPTEAPTRAPTGAPTTELPATPAATATTPPDVTVEQVPSPFPTSSPLPATSPEKARGGMEVGTMALLVLGIIMLALGLAFLIGRRVRR